MTAEVGETAPRPEDGAEPVRCEIAGTVLDVWVAVGDRVSVGDEVALLESMKMEIPVIAETGGIVRSLTVAKSVAVAVDDVIVTISPDA